jgi:predicted nucleic acid-binding Zn ribbon protein
LRREHAGGSRRGEKRTRSGPVSTAAALKELAQRLRIARTLSEYEVLTSWRELVGDQVARVAVPERIERGILFVSVSNPSWRSELTMRRLEIRELINQAVGNKVVKEIRFR